MQHNIEDYTVDVERLKSISVTQHIERDLLGQKIKIKIDIVSCSFCSSFVQNVLNWDIAFLRYGNFIEECHNTYRLVKS